MKFSTRCIYFIVFATVEIDSTFPFNLSFCLSFALSSLDSVIDVCDTSLIADATAGRLIAIIWQEFLLERWLYHYDGVSPDFFRVPELIVRVSFMTINIV